MNDSVVIIIDIKLGECSKVAIIGEDIWKAVIHLSSYLVEWRASLPSLTVPRPQVLMRVLSKYRTNNTIQYRIV